MEEFRGFRKIPRYNREVIVTEKIDGTNASIYIGENGEFNTASRKRWITPEDDNHGFSKWAHAHKDELMTIGPGHHFGEWWGSGINRGYGLKGDDKRFSMFNVSRFCVHGATPATVPTEDPRVSRVQLVLPPCVGLVPVLWSGLFSDFDLRIVLDVVRELGSSVVTGYMNPEGIVIYHTAGNLMFKATLEKDDEPKSKVKVRQES